MCGAHPVFAVRSIHGWLAQHPTCSSDNWVWVILNLRGLLIEDRWGHYLCGVWISRLRTSWQHNEPLAWCACLDQIRRCTRGTRATSLSPLRPAAAAAAATSCTLPAACSADAEEDFSPTKHDLTGCSAEVDPQSAVISNQAGVTAHLLINEWWSLPNRGQSWRINYWSRRLIKRWLCSRLWPRSLRAWRGFVSLAGWDFFFNNSVSHLLIWGGVEK